MYLVLINGPCGVGKSVTSKALQAKIKGSVLVELDEIRGKIPADQFTKNGHHDSYSRTWHANQVGVNEAEEALIRGKTVIVDALKYHPEWIEPWEELGKSHGAKVLDIFLIAPKKIVEDRAAARGYEPGGPLTPQKVAELYDLVVGFYKDRSGAIRIDNEQLTVSEVVESVAQNLTA